jgi:hypothetical protein
MAKLILIKVENPGPEDPALIRPLNSLTLSRSFLNSNIEFRNSKQIQNPNVLMTKTKDWNFPINVNGFVSYV